MGMWRITALKPLSPRLLYKFLIYSKVQIKPYEEDFYEKFERFKKYYSYLFISIDSFIYFSIIY